MIVEMIGKFRDTLRYKSIHGFDKVEKRDWIYNQIQDSAAKLLITQLAGGYSVFSNFGGINYLALGEGLQNWDNASATKPYTNTTLLTEANITNSRVLVGPNDFTYLDSNNNALSPQSASDRVRLDVTIGLNDGIGNLREFGLFGGDATATVDSGIMVNWVDHPLIVKDNRLIINREIILSLSFHRA